MNPFQGGLDYPFDSQLRWLFCPACDHLSVSYGPWDSIVAVAFKHAISHPVRPFATSADSEIHEPI